MNRHARSRTKIHEEEKKVFVNLRLASWMDFCIGLVSILIVVIPLQFWEMVIPKADRSLLLLAIRFISNHVI
jgi:hypothetical protein